MRFVILHYHILKNAGTTIEEGLDRSFGHRLARLDQAQRDATIGAAELLSFVEARPQLAAVTSHQIRYPLPEAPGLMFFDICFLRDPIDRVRSLYDYYRDKPDPGDPVSDVANTSDLGGFVRGMVREQALQVRNDLTCITVVGLSGRYSIVGALDRDVSTANLAIIPCGND